MSSSFASCLGNKTFFFLTHTSSDNFTIQHSIPVFTPKIVLNFTFPKKKHLWICVYENTLNKPRKQAVEREGVTHFVRDIIFGPTVFTVLAAGNCGLKNK